MNKVAIQPPYINPIIISLLSSHIHTEYKSDCSYPLLLSSSTLTRLYVSSKTLLLQHFLPNTYTKETTSLDIIIP